MEIRIGEVKAADLTAIEGLVENEFAYLDLDRYPFRQKLSDVRFRLLKVTCENKFAGFLELEWLESWVVRINGLVVVPSFRRKGIARVLLEFALNDVRTRGADTVTLLVSSNNEVAKQLYSSFGFSFDHVWPEHIQEKEVEVWKLDLATDTRINVC